MIEIVPDRFYYGYWWRSAGQPYDWLCIAWREDDRMMGMFRHRFGGENNRRSWFTFASELKPNAVICAELDHMADAITNLADLTASFIVPGTKWTREQKHVCALGVEFEEQFAAASFVHKTPVSEQERDAILREIAGARPC